MWAGPAGETGASARKSQQGRLATVLAARNTIKIPNAITLRHYHSPSVQVEPIPFRSLHYNEAWCRPQSWATALAI